MALVKGKPFVVRLMYGVLKPKDIIPGGDVAGRVEAVGINVKQFQPGDEVFGDLASCGAIGVEHITGKEAIGYVGAKK